MDIEFGRFEWDFDKEIKNLEKHGVDFITASQAFVDPGRKVYLNSRHSEREQRYFCVGLVKDRVITVRFTYRENRIRIIGAGYWRKGRAYYEAGD